MANGGGSYFSFHSPLLNPPLPIRRVLGDVLRDLALPAIAVIEKLGFVVIQFLAGFDRELHVGALHDGVDRAGLLAKAAINAFHHVDVIAGRAARAVVPARASLDGDGLGGADRLAKLARDAAFFAIGIA